MTSSDRLIRSIERTAVNTRVRAVSAFAHYPYRGGEPLLPSDDRHEWNHMLRQAAGSAAEWLQAAGRAQRELDELALELSRRLRDDIPAEESLRMLADLLNRLESAYQRHASALKPELWASVELALRHPAAEAFGLRRSPADGTWTIAAAATKESSGAIQASKPSFAQSSDSKRMRMRWQNDKPHSDIMRKEGEILDRQSDLRMSGQFQKQGSYQARSLEQKQEQRLVIQLMIGADGMLCGLKLALAYGDQLKTVDLVQARFTGTLPYTVYYGAMQSCRPLPYTGLILNRLI